MSKSACIGFAFVLSGLAGLSSAALAQDNVMKTCGDKWRVAKETNVTGGQTWTQFLAKCRTDTAAAAPALAPATSPATAPAPAATAPAPASAVAPAKPATPDKPAIAAAPAKPAVYPSAISSKFSSEKSYRARQKTCSEQYRANKANDANGGQRWLEKGGGYWSQCNKRLKETRA